MHSFRCADAVHFKCPLPSCQMDINVSLNSLLADTAIPVASRTGMQRLSLAVSRHLAVHCKGRWKCPYCSDNISVNTESLQKHMARHQRIWDIKHYVPQIITNLVSATSSPDEAWNQPIEPLLANLKGVSFNFVCVLFWSFQPLFRLRIDPLLYLTLPYVYIEYRRVYSRDLG